MKKELISIVLACAFVMPVLAAPVVNFSDDSKTFLKERRDVDGFRTKNLVQNGLMKKGSLTKGGSVKDASRAFVVSVSSDSTDFRAMEKGLVSKNYHIFDKTENILAAVNYESGVKLNMNLVGENPQGAAQLLLASMFPEDVAKQFDFLVMDLEIDEYEDGSSEISEYVFNFVRVFNNRVVRGLDKMSIYVSVEGVAEMVVARMSNLKVSEEYVLTSEDFTENVSALNRLITDKFSIAYSNEKEQKIEVKDVDINGVAEAYCLEEGDTATLQPCLSYTARVIFDTGDTISYVFDAPYASSGFVLAENNDGINDYADESDNGVKIVEVRRDMVAFELQEAGDAVVTFYDTDGSRVARAFVSNARVGYNVVRIDANKISRGRYTVSVEVGKNRGSKGVWVK